MNPNVTQLLSADPNRTVMGTAPTLNATQTIKPVQCPVCRTFNPAGVMFCVECGLIFDRALPDDAFGAPVVRLPVLVDSNGKEYPIRPGANVVGREGDVMLADAKVSRRHAQITSSDGVYELEDLGSTNGTEWNGEKLAQGEKRTLSQGDKVSFGGIELTLSMPGAAGSTEMLSPNRTAMLSGPPSADIGTEGQGDRGAEGHGDGGTKGQRDQGTGPQTQDPKPHTPDPEPQPPAAYLSIDGSDMPLKSGVNTFGRKPENDVQIVDPYVSGKHGVIDVRDDGIYLTDTGSTNGTLVNGEKLEPNAENRVTEEDEIRIGGLVLRVRTAI